ncbi:hypothetical protein B296_00016933 [Ensete ventricosum]|uniref:Bidirectional sugar transporter SWEET n=1 Tax=Ensete ventricosum TaxID=4639 RepID=A0A426YS98_ENSVE|nr:hypothetical protein B296_00016933 [Ensete ventricosum]
MNRLLCSINTFGSLGSYRYHQHIQEAEGSAKCSSAKDGGFSGYLSHSGWDHRLVDFIHPLCVLYERKLKDHCGGETESNGDVVCSLDAGNGTALVLFLSPAPTFHRIWRSGSVEQFHATPYLATLLNCMFWILYGLPMVHPHSTLILTINGSGLVIELVYVLIFLRCSDRARKLRVFLVLLAEILLVGAVAAADLTLVHGYQRRSLIVGVLCVVFGTVMYAAPLSVMVGFGFSPPAVACLSSRLPQLLLNLQIPNGLGVAFAAAQLILHMMYHASTKQQMKERKMKIEMGLAKPNGSLKEDLETGSRNGS